MNWKRGSIVMNKNTPSLDLLGLQSLKVLCKCDLAWIDVPQGTKSLQTTPLESKKTISIIFWTYGIVFTIFGYGEFLCLFMWCSFSLWSITEHPAIISPDNSLQKLNLPWNNVLERKVQTQNIDICGCWSTDRHTASTQQCN